MLNLANNAIYHGDTDQAEELLNRLLSIQPRNPQAHWSLAGLRRATDRTHVDSMRKLLENEQNPRAKAFFCYGIGKELDVLDLRRHRNGTLNRRRIRR